MSASEPYLSIVVTSRNDDHGGNLLRRMQLFVDGLIAQCRRHRLDAELIIVEWNPPADRPRLAEALCWPEETSPCQVRIIEVPEKLHRRYPHAKHLPLFQMIAKNVGIRRARGQFVLATNIDILFADELMAFIAARQLEPRKLYRIDRHDVMADVPYPASIEDQLAWCRTHLLRLNAREGSFPLTPDGEIRLAADDIVAPSLGIGFGRGWFPPEQQQGETSRWAGPDAVLVVKEDPALPRVLALELEPGPGVSHQPFLLEIRDRQGQIVARGRVQDRQRIQFRLPPTTEPVAEYELHVPEDGRAAINDWRIRNFRVFECYRCEDWQGAEPADEEAINFRRREVLRGIGGRVERNDIVAEDLGLRFGPGWHPVEEWNGSRFRWAANNAALIVSPAASEQTVSLAIEPGPGVDYRPFSLEIRDEIGETVARHTVAGEKIITLPLPARPQRRRTFILHTDRGGAPAPGDGRILNFRVIGPIRPGRPLLPFTARGLMKKLVRAVTPWAPGLVKLLARRRTQQRLGMPLPPAVETAPAPVAPAPTLSAGEDIVSPVALHTNASGDFTLLDRDTWLQLKGHPEFATYSLNIDSLLCYMAHHAGANEVVLPEPMRIYHIEHSNGSGWTPEGETTLFARLKELGIPLLGAGEVMNWATQMRRQGTALRFNNPDWGLGNEALPEITPRPKVIPGEPKEASANLLAKSALQPPWQNPFAVLRTKWHEVPAGKSRYSTAALASWTEPELLALWRQCHDQQVGNYGLRGWYHALYRDVLRGKRVLDVGSGFGIDALSFARAGAHVTCADVVQGNLHILERLARHQGLANIDFYYLDDFASLRQLPNDYDVLWCQGSMHHAPFEVVKEECRELLRHLRPQGRWIQLAYPKTRWEREGRMPFAQWGDKTDGGAPWTEWYDLQKVLDLLAPARFNAVLNLEFHNSDFNWFDLQRMD